MKYTSFMPTVYNMPMLPDVHPVNGKEFLALMYVFVKPGTQIDSTYYQDKLLLLPAMPSIAGEVYMFLQNNAPAHCACQAAELLCRDTPKLTAAAMWPPNRDVTKFKFDFDNLLNSNLRKSHL